MKCKTRQRDRIDIVSQILQIANGGIDSKTKIMYIANLSHAQLKEYLTFLIENDLLSYDLDTRTFKTTEKGLKFIDTYDRIDAMIKI
jgi:predicted transcriptional regulator